MNNSLAAAEDVYAFLVLFISKVVSIFPDAQLKANLFQFRDYSKLDFHIAGESYAGTYIPNIASVRISNLNQNS